MQSPTVTVTDPKGKWTFTARAKTMTLAGREGPYTMTQAAGTYQPAGQPPVRIWANRMYVDRGAQRITLTGAVKVVSSAVVVEGEHLTYDLKTGKVQAIGPTKWTFTGKRMTAGTASGGASGEKR